MCRCMLAQIVAFVLFAIFYISVAAFERYLFKDRPMAKRLLLFGTASLLGIGSALLLSVLFNYLP